MNARWTANRCLTVKAKRPVDQGKCLERATGIEPAFSAWEADVLPLNYARTASGTPWPDVGHCIVQCKMILSDRSIREEVANARIVIDPFDDTCVQPSSVDLHVDRFFRVFRNHSQRVIDVKEDQEELTELVEVIEEDALILHPGEFVLGATLERIALPDDLVGRLEGKSSLGRLGLLIHSTAGFVDPGFDGHLTLELSNVANLPITVYPEMKIGQISFLRMTGPAESPYGSSALQIEVPASAGPDAKPLLRELSRLTQGTVTAASIHCLRDAKKARPGIRRVGPSLITS